jgi:16S rRNA processing protein RimM
MKKRFLEAGRVAGTHGVRGQIKLECWCDSPEFLLKFDSFYIGGRQVQVEKSSVFKNMLLIKLAGVDDLNAAMSLKGVVFHIDREKISLPEGRHFVQDILGLAVIDADTGEKIGALEDVYSLPAHDVYVVKGERSYLIPAVPEFIESVDTEAGTIRIRLIEGMEDSNAH